MTDYEKQVKKVHAVWRWSFYTRMVDFRLLLTPFGIVDRSYYFGNNESCAYHDVYVFGVRLARVQI